MLSADSLDTNWDAAPAAIAHAARVVPAQAHAAQHVDLPELVPQRVVDVEELARAVDAEVVDEDVGVRARGGQRGGAFGGAEVGDHAGGVVAAAVLAQLHQRLVHARLAAADEGDRGAGLRQTGGDGQADATGGAGDDGGLAGKVDLHWGTPVRGAALDQPKRNAESVVFMTSSE